MPVQALVLAISDESYSLTPVFRCPCREKLVLKRLLSLSTLRDKPHVLRGLGDQF